MMSRTSPAIAAVLTGGCQVAFQANTGHLLTWNSTTGAADTQLGMMVGTSPSITTAPGASGYEVAFRANSGYLLTSSPIGGTVDNRIGMMAGTSPAVGNSLTWLRH